MTRYELDLDDEELEWLRSIVRGQVGMKIIWTAEDVEYARMVARVAEKLGAL